MTLDLCKKHHVLVAYTLFALLVIIVTTTFMCIEYFIGTVISMATGERTEPAQVDAYEVSSLRSVEDTPALYSLSKVMKVGAPSLGLFTLVCLVWLAVQTIFAFLLGRILSRSQ